MKGMNVIEMNHDTMCEAIQLWLDEKFKDPPVVTSVEPLKEGGYNSGSRTFKILVKEKEVVET